MLALYTYMLQWWGYVVVIEPEAYELTPFCLFVMRLNYTAVSLLKYVTGVRGITHWFFGYDFLFELAPLKLCSLVTSYNFSCLLNFRHFASIPNCFHFLFILLFVILYGVFLISADKVATVCKFYIIWLVCLIADMLFVNLEFWNVYFKTN